MHLTDATLLQLQRQENLHADIWASHVGKIHSYHDDQPHGRPLRWHNVEKNNVFGQPFLVYKCFLFCFAFHPTNGWKMSSFAAV